MVPQTAAVGVDVDRLVTGEEDSCQDALPYSWQPGGPITLASGTRGAKAGNVRQEKHNMKSFPYKGRLGIAAAGMASLLLVGCGSGSGSSGPESSAALMTGDPTETASTAVSSQDASSTVTSSHGAEPASFMAEAELHTPDGEQIGTVDFAVDGSCTNVTCPTGPLRAFVAGRTQS